MEIAGQEAQRKRSGSGIPSAVVDAGPGAFWTEAPGDLCRRLSCGTIGLTAAEAAEQLDRVGPNLDKPPRRAAPLRALLPRLLEPLVLMLLGPPPYRPPRGCGQRRDHHPRHRRLDRS